MSSHATLGELLKRHRIEAFLSQEALADASGVSVRTISDLERGQRSHARLETVRLLADALQLDDGERALILAGVSAADHSSDVSGSRNRNGFSGSGLPVPASPLIGRGAVLSDIVALIASNEHRLITMTGPGGVGKTRLAIEAARKQSDWFSDGAVFVDLSTLSGSGQVLSEIVDALGLFATPADGRELGQRLGDRHMLLVLDNFEHVLEAAIDVAGLVREAPNLSILVTSRTPLRVSVERIVSIPPMQVPAIDWQPDEVADSESVVFFVDRATAIGADRPTSEDELAPVATICRTLDGIPLALQLAASRVRTLPVATLADQLGTGLSLLAYETRDLPERQRTMEATIAWTYELLEPDEQRSLRWLSVFVGGFSLDAASFISQTCGKGRDALSQVTSLVEFGLVRRSFEVRSEPRFVMFETTREFGLAQLENLGELQLARTAHTDFFKELIGRHLGDLSPALNIDLLDIFDIDRTNILNALDSVCAGEDDGSCMRMASQVGAFWWYRHEVSEGIPRLERAVAAGSQSASIDRIQALAWLSKLRNLEQKDVVRAKQLALEAQALADELGNERGIGLALNARGYVEELQLNFDEAIEIFEQAVELWRKLGEHGMAAWALMVAGGAAWGSGDLQRAIELETEARELHELSGHKGGEHLSAWYLGLFALHDGTLRDAANYFQEALTSWLRSRDLPYYFKPLVGLSAVAAEFRMFEASAQLLGASDGYLKRTGQELYPFDKPVYQRAKTLAVEALGSGEFETEREIGVRMNSEGWLELAASVSERARSAGERNVTTKNGTHCGSGG